jgi:membrane-bound lytic murein transglycosylase A
MKYKYLVLLCIVCAFFISCLPRVEKPGVPLNLIDSYNYPVFDDDLDLESLQLAVDRSLEYYNRLPESRMYHFGTSDCTVKELKETLLEFKKIIQSSDSIEIINKEVRNTFDVYKSIGAIRKGRVLFTGYYAPVLKGSLDETEEYKYPIYRTPDDHIIVNLEQFSGKYEGERIIARYKDGEVIPYYTREDIDEKGCLKDRGLEIAWLADPVDLFFLHIQGSGIVSLPDGRFLQISYDQSNGHPYRSVGRLLMDQEKISSDEMSLKSIKNYLQEHPEEMSDILNHNESYVFFSIVEEGPRGSLNLTVTPGRTIATDSSLFPKGALAFIIAKKPVIDSDGNIISWSRFSRFVLNQDTGGAITGPGRVDLYCGSGKYAEVMAGHLKEEGELYFLVKKRR